MADLLTQRLFKTSILCIIIFSFFFLANQLEVHTQSHILGCTRKSTDRSMASDDIYFTQTKADPQRCEKYKLALSLFFLLTAIITSSHFSAPSGHFLT